MQTCKGAGGRAPLMVGFSGYLQGARPCKSTGMVHVIMVGFAANLQGEHACKHANDPVEGPGNGGVRRLFARGPSLQTDVQLGLMGSGEICKGTCSQIGKKRWQRTCCPHTTTSQRTLVTSILTRQVTPRGRRILW